MKDTELQLTSERYVEEEEGCLTMNCTINLRLSSQIREVIKRNLF